MNIKTVSLLAVGIFMLTTVSWGADSSPGTPVPNDAVQAYAFTGTVENIQPDSSVAASIGDRVTGTFIIDHTAVSIPLNDSHVSYRFASGIPLVFTVNTMQFGAAPSSLPCMAAVANNELAEGKTLDYFRITCTDDALRSSLGIRFLAATFNVSDSSAAVFSGTGLPRDVDLQSFDNAWLVLKGMRHCNKGEQCSELVFAIMMRIETIAKK
jgi:hypothetical protein